MSRSRNGDLVTTDKGYQFLLMNFHDQVFLAIDWLMVYRVTFF